MLLQGIGWFALAVALETWFREDVRSVVRF